MNEALRAWFSSMEIKERAKQREIATLERK